MFSFIIFDAREGCRTGYFHFKRFEIHTIALNGSQNNVHTEDVIYEMLPIHIFTNHHFIFSQATRKYKHNTFNHNKTIIIKGFPCL